MAQTRSLSPPPAAQARRYPYLDLLQPKMEEMLTNAIPRQGRFCGFCYGRLKREQEACAFCGRPTEDVQPVDAVPPEVLEIYRRKRKREGLIVHLGAFTGLLIGAAVFLALVMSGLHPAIGFAFLIFGSYLLAQLCGPIIGGQIGYAWGAGERDRLWTEYLERRGRQT